MQCFAVLVRVENLSFRFCHFHLQLHISKAKALSTNILFQLTFQSVNGPHQKNKHFPGFSFILEVSTRETHVASLQPFIPLSKARLGLLVRLTNKLFDSVPTVPGVGELQPVNQIQPTSWFCSFSFMGTWPYWFLHLCSVALSHLKSRGKDKRHTNHTAYKISAMGSGQINPRGTPLLSSCLRTCNGHLLLLSRFSRV